MILDQWGNPIEPATLREAQSPQVAWLRHEWQEHPARGLTPARLNALLTDAEQGNWLAQLDLADDMLERDGHVFSELDKRTAAVAPVSWEVKAPRNATAAEQAATERVASWLADLPDWAGLLRGLMDGVLKGFAAFEMTWDMQGRELLPAQLDFRPQRWFCQSECRTQIHLRDASAWGQPLKPFGWIVHRHRSMNGYLARNGLVRVLALPYLFKWLGTSSFAEFLELYGLPIRIGKYPTGATPAEKSRLLAAVVGLGRKAAGIIPQGMQIDLEKATASGTEVPFEAMCNRMDAIQSKVIVGQTLTSGEGQHGTQALGKVHNEVRMDIRDSDLQQLAATLTAQVIWPMVALNIAGIERRRCPRLEFITAEGEDLAEYADNLPKLAGAGLRIGVAWAHERLRIPMAADGEPVLAVQAAPAAPAGTPQPPAKAALKAAPDAASAPEPDALDDVAAAELADWRPLLAPMVNPLMAELRNSIAAGESLADFAARADSLLAAMRPEALGASLGNALAKARLAGEADADLSRGRT